MAIDPITGLPSSNVQNKDGSISYPSPTIEATKIGTTAPIKLPIPSPYDVGNYTSAINNTAGSIEAQTNAALAQQEAQQKLAQAQAGSNDIATLQSQLGGKAGETANLYQSTGVNTAYNQLQDLNAQATGLKNEASAIPIANRLQAQTLGTAGTENQVQNVNYDQLQRNALKALSLGQQAAIAESNFNKAKNLADQQVEIKYGQMEADLKAKQTQLDALNKYQLTPAQEKAKSALERQYKLQDQELADKKAEAKAVNELMSNAYAQGVPSKIAEKAKAIQERGGTQAEVAAALGVYSGDYLSRQIKLAQLNELGLKNKKAMQELYGDSTGLKSLSFEDNAKFNSTPEAKGIKDATGYAKAVADYKAAIEKYGTGELFGKGSGELGQAYSALVGATKDYYTLGTLDNGVQKLIALGIPEPGLIGLKAGRIDALDTAYNAAADTIKRNADQLLSTKYAKTNELKQLIDNAGGVLMYKMTNDQLLNSIPGSGQGNTNTTSTNSNFFNK